MSRPGKLVLAFPSDARARRPAMSVDVPISAELLDDPDQLFNEVAAVVPELKSFFVKWLDELDRDVE